MIEVRRIEAEYDAAKRSFDQTPEISKAVSDTWGRIESLQTQEVRFLLKKELGVISQKTSGLINQTIQKALLDCGMSLEDMDVGEERVEHLAAVYSNLMATEGALKELLVRAEALEWPIVF